MNDKVKRIIGAVGTFLAGILAGIAALLHHRRAVDEPGAVAAEAEAGIADARNAVREADAGIERLQGRADDIEQTVEAIGRSAREIGANQQTIDDILEAVRKQQKVGDSDME